jgi:acyl carrier protein
MSEADLIEGIKEVIDTEMELSRETLLEEIDYYDSVAVLSLMSYFDELGVGVAPKDFEELKTVGDLVDLAGSILDDR